MRLQVIGTAMLAFLAPRPARRARCALGLRCTRFAFAATRAAFGVARLALAAGAARRGAFALGVRRAAVALLAREAFGQLEPRDRALQQLFDVREELRFVRAHERDRLTR